MKNIYRLILSAHIAAFGIQWAADTAEAQVLGPGDDAIITPDGRTIINPPLPNPQQSPPPIQNADGSTTYPVGTTPPPTDGFTQVNRDGSVTIFPRESAPSGNQPEAPSGSDAPTGFDFRLPWRVSDDLQLRARYDYFNESETPEPQEDAPSRNDADAPEGLDLRYQYPFSDDFQLRLPYDYQPESGAEDELPTEPAPPTIEFIDEETPAIDPEAGDGETYRIYPYMGRMDGGSVYIDPPTLDLDFDDEPPVDSVIPELQNYGPFPY